MRRRIPLLASAIAACLAAAPAAAEDIDVYMENNAGDGIRPQVMFILDYRPNLYSTVCTDVANTTDCPAAVYFADEPGFPTEGPLSFMDLLRFSMQRVAKNLSAVEVGLMISHNYDNNCAGPGKTNCSNGAYILSGFKPFVADDSNSYKQHLYEKLAAIPPSQGNVSHSYQGKEIYFELFRYLTGQGVYNAHNGYKDYDYKDRTKNLDVERPAIAWDTSIERDGNTRYISPIAGSQCSRVFAVNIIFGTSNQDSDSDNAIKAPRADGGMGFAPKTYEDVIRWMYSVDLGDGSFGDVGVLPGKQNVTSYFLIKGERANVNSYAQAGGTGSVISISDDPATIVEALESIFNQILSVSTTFVAASVPVNAFSRAEVLNSVYIALFQARQEPRWCGNLKKLKFSDDRTVLEDALGANAVGTDGRINQAALTFWTVGDALPPADPNLLEIEGRDGRSVVRGGAGQKIPGMIGGAIGETNDVDGARRLFTEPDSYVNGTPAALRPLNADDATASVLRAALGAASDEAARCLLRFVRGFDVNWSDCTGEETREWLLGDPLHSRPLPVNYGARGAYTRDNPDIRILMGGNDGYMRMFRDLNSAGEEDGGEAWAFMPREVLAIQERLRDDNAGVPRHPYGVDGAPVVYVRDVNGNGTIEGTDKVWLYFGLRRGGARYYALDISDPDNPKMLWSIGPTGDFAEIGLTFSNPRVGDLDYGHTSGLARPVLIFGGGYDTNKDARGAVGTDDEKGNALYVVDAETGALVWKAVQSGTASSTVFVQPDLRDSIPSDVTAVDTNGNGLIDRVYVGDTGGVIWRADLAGKNRAAWTMTPVLSVGRHAFPGDEANDRRFFHRPDFVMSKDDYGAFDAVVIGSGNRADPRATHVQDWFYVFKDRDITSGTLTTTEPLEHDDLEDLTEGCYTEVCTHSEALANGWRMELEGGGEKSLATPMTIAGSVYFTTYIPPDSVDAETCGPAEGGGRFYRISLQDARAVANLNVNNDDTMGDDGEWEEVIDDSDRYLTLDSGGIPAEVISIPPDKVMTPDLKIYDTGVRGAWRTFWYQAGE
jgi:type IV pilus assembly protein PilY1